MTRLIFVYNADTGFFNSLADLAHTVISPATYRCNLCAVTHGLFRMHPEWREFVTGLGVPVEFLHRDEFVARYGMRECALPAIFESGEDQVVRVWMTAQEINEARTLATLRERITSRLRNPSLETL